MEQDYNITPSGYIYGRDPKSTVPFWNVDTLKSLNEEIDKLNGDIDNLNTEINNLQIEIERLESEKELLERNVSELNSRIQELETENQTLEDNILNLNNQIHQLEIEKQNLINQINDLNNQVSTLESEKQNLQNNINSLNIQIQELNNNINNLEAENQGLSTELSNYPDYMVGFKPFPDGTELNYTIPKNNSITLNDFINRFPNIICDKVNINFLNGKFGYRWSSLPSTLNLKELTVLYPPETNGIVNYNTQPLVKKVTFKGYTIYSSILSYYISVSKNPAILTPYYPKVVSFDQFGNNPATHSLKIKLQFDSNNLLDSGSYNQNCLILDYGNLSLSKVNVKIEGISNSYGKPTVQNLVDSGITIFVSDNQYDLFVVDPNFSLFGDKLRRLSEYVESEWIS